ncbi:MAG: alpha/beta hydrolase [Chloroflexota bacterium]
MPDIRFAQSGDVSVAYTTFGAGPIDVVWVAGSYTHLEIQLEFANIQDQCRRMAEFCRLILFDKRGMGMSDRVPGTTPLEERMDDIRAVMDAAGSASAAILGESEGGPLAMLFAAAHPERVSALILQGAEVCERTTPDWPWGEATDEEFEASIETLPDRWGRGNGFAVFAPDYPDQAWGRAWLSRLQRNAATPTAIVGWARMAHEIDVRHVPAVRVPTLVLHSTDDASIVHLENGRFLARTIPAPSTSSRPARSMSRQDPAPIVAEIREFSLGRRADEEPDRILATVLYSRPCRFDRHGVAAGRCALAAGARRSPGVRAPLARGPPWRRGRLGGRRIPGDLRRPARAVRCAREIVAGAESLGLRVRAGVHTGRSSGSPTKWPGSRCTSGPASRRRPVPGKCWRRARCATSSPGAASPSRIGERAS